MTTVYSVTELKQAIEKGETMVKAGNKQMEKVLNLLCNAFPVAGGVVAGGALAAVIAKIAAGGAITIAGATATISAISLTTGQVWVLVIVGALVVLILAIKAHGIKIEKITDKDGKTTYRLVYRAKK